MLGRPVADQLKADGFQVRVLSRSPQKAARLFGKDFEICQGDIEDRASLDQALQDCMGVHINLKGGPTAEDYDRVEYRGTQAIVQAAQTAGLQRISYLSGYTIQEKNAHSLESQAKYKAEEAIRASGIPYTFFRATWFMESLPLFIQGKQALVIGKQPNPLHWVAAADYARMVSRSYQASAAVNKALYIYGPQAFTMRQALEVFCHRLLPQVSVKTLPIGWLALLGKITFQADWQSLARLMAYYDQVGEEGDPQEANGLLGAPQTTLQQWCDTQRQKTLQLA